MEARVLLVAALVGVAAPLASADIMAAGPYAVDILEFGACDDGEYPGISVNVSLVFDEQTNDTTYRGYITIIQDFFEDDYEFQATTYMWGSTGGWTQVFYYNYTTPFDYSLTNFPTIFALILEPLGITEKPVPPGTYYLPRFMPREFHVKEFPAMGYGKYRTYLKSVKDGLAVACLRFIYYVYHAENSQGVGFRPPY